MRFGNCEVGHENRKPEAGYFGKALDGFSVTIVAWVGQGIKGSCVDQDSPFVECAGAISLPGNHLARLLALMRHMQETGVRGERNCPRRSIVRHRPQLSF